MWQTARHAEYVADVATIAKLLAGCLQHFQSSLVSAAASHTHAEHMCLEKIFEILIADAPVKFTPPMQHKIVKNPRVNQDELPRNAKRIRKHSPDSAH